MITFVTGSKDKFREAAAILGVELEMVELDLPEVQSLDVCVVAEKKARDAYRELKKPLFVQDAGLEVNALKGFPGALQAWVAKTIGSRSLLKLVDNDRKARAVACVAYHDGNRVHTFRGETEGTLAKSEREGYGWDFDFIFIPEGYKQTFSEMGMEEKNKISHMHKALCAFSEHLEGKS